jgi:hypothetical protein
MPERPAFNASKYFSRPTPLGLRAPMPLMTIRWLGISARDNVTGKAKIAK